MITLDWKTYTEKKKKLIVLHVKWFQHETFKQSEPLPNIKDHCLCDIYILPRHRTLHGNIIGNPFKSYIYSKTFIDWNSFGENIRPSFIFSLTFIHVFSFLCIEIYDSSLVSYIHTCMHTYIHTKKIKLIHT